MDTELACGLMLGPETAESTLDPPLTSVSVIVNTSSFSGN